MNAAAEGTMPGLAPGNVELVGPAEYFGIAVGRDQHRVDNGIGRHGEAAEIGVFPEYAARDGYRGLKTQALLYRGARELGARREQLERLWIARETPHAVGDEADSGFQTGNQQADTLL